MKRTEGAADNEGFSHENVFASEYTLTAVLIELT